ncbi:hypothetical protein QBC40DRAFT_295556 [Triangularia verruculosa]|uniref:Uncharacterized protein n=1 Tax=Triangularia verruculosa TaxID=2587418 RepID=A0AAN7AWY8_9PEZI|nr:hypothetical protein QBC40DRAFT_295556 [Triangularia verruculosa]
MDHDAPGDNDGGRDQRRAPRRPRRPRASARAVRPGTRYFCYLCTETDPDTGEQRPKPFSKGSNLNRHCNDFHGRYHRTMPEYHASIRRQNAPARRPSQRRVAAARNPAGPGAAQSSHAPAPMDHLLPAMVCISLATTRWNVANCLQAQQAPIAPHQPQEGDQIPSNNPVDARNNEQQQYGFPVNNGNSQYSGYLYAQIQPVAQAPPAMHWDPNLAQNVQIPQLPQFQQFAQAQQFDQQMAQYTSQYHDHLPMQPTQQASQPSEFGEEDPQQVPQYMSQYHHHPLMEPTQQAGQQSQFSDENAQQMPQYMSQYNHHPLMQPTQQAGQQSQFSEEDFLEEDDLDPGVHEFYKSLTDNGYGRGPY